MSANILTNSAICFSTCIVIFLSLVYAAPVGPSATLVESRTRAIPGNATINESTGGGYIYVHTFDVLEQNKRWKAYVGNVTGSLTLDDASGYTIYDWDLGTVTGEVYATRDIDTVNWTGITCANISHLTDEDSAMSHTRIDSINNTFNGSSKNHPAFLVGPIDIPQDDCYSILTYVNDTAQSTTEYFPEIVLYDNDSKIVYATKMENNLPGFDGANNSVNNTYDFQILVPENGQSSSSSIAYYFYVELA